MAEHQGNSSNNHNNPGVDRGRLQLSFPGFQGNNSAGHFSTLSLGSNNTVPQPNVMGRGPTTSSTTMGLTGPTPPPRPTLGCTDEGRIRPRPKVRLFPQTDIVPDKTRSLMQTDRFKLRERFKICQSIHSTGTLQISPDLAVNFTSEDLQDLGEIGRGAFGTVNKMVHRSSNTVMAVKRIRSTVDEKDQKQLLMDLGVVMKTNCPYIVQFYGALFKEGDCWICMELMDTSLDKFYKYIYEKLNQRVPEPILGKITVATVKALNYLKEELKIIHRDVKPSNILLDRRGDIKLCDFGISGQLVDSIARTRDAGCRPYMAPERIDPQRAKGYDVRSDVWSLGITLMEVATGHFPYPKWNTVFEQLQQVVQGDPPKLSSNDHFFTTEFVDFVNTCLLKDETQRPKYNKLLEHPFLRTSDVSTVDVASYVNSILDRMAINTRPSCDDPSF